MTTLVLWLSVSVQWFTPEVTVEAGPAVWVNRVDPVSLAEDSLSVEPANIGYAIVGREVSLESRLDAYLTLPPSR